MNDTFNKPLTPKFREEINKSIDDKINELMTCKPNAFVSAQLEGYKVMRNIFNTLPDGYPVPMERRR